MARVPFLLASLVFLAACDREPPSAAPRDTLAQAPEQTASDQAPTPTPTRADGTIAVPERNYVEVNLVAFSCGDNCYLTFDRRSEGSERQTFLCLASRCGLWRDTGELPPALEGSIAEVRFGKADQRDNEGTVMNADVDAVVDILAIRPQPTAAERGAKGPLPLRPGIFVEDGIACSNPPNAAFKRWDGSGLSGSSTRNCRARATQTGRIEWRVANDCENTYDGSRSTETFEIAISDPERFGMKARSFRRCEMRDLPKSLRDLLAS